MISTSLQGVAELVIRRARRQGYVVPREVREELTQAGVPDSLWKDVVAVARPALRYRNGRYYYLAPVSDRVRREQSQQRDIHRTVRQLIRQHQATAEQVERREEDRLDFIQPVLVVTEDQRRLSLLSRDISPTGIRLVGTSRLLGQKVHVHIPRPDSTTPWSFLVRILWTCAVGDGLFENGGTFIQVADPPPATGADV